MSETQGPAPPVGRIRRVARSVFFWIGVVATILGVWEGIDHLREVMRERAERAVLNTPLVASNQVLRLSGSDPVTETTIVADRIEVSGGTHQIPAGSVWLANSVTFSDGATIRGASLSIIARTVSGGRLDVSGISAVAPRVNPTAGGDITLFASQIQNVELIARGGDGAPGAAGGPGADGRDGDCGGFGAYKGAQEEETAETAAPVVKARRADTYESPPPQSRRL